MQQQPFRFAVMGAGGIANKFCEAVRLLDGACVTAIASKSQARAQAFVEKHGLPAAYDSYERMLEAEKPDCVYIAVTSDAHYALSRLCLTHGVPVLCEKAMFLNAAQAEEIFALAREKQVFVMEAMWSRFLPAVRRAKEWVETGRIGAPAVAGVQIGFHAEEDPANRFFSPALGGGAAFDLTVYCYEIMTYLIDRPVEVVHASAVMGETGVDVTDQIVLRFAEAGGQGAVLASLRSTLLADLDDRLEIYGSQGKIVLAPPHCTSEAWLYGPDGSCIEHFTDTVTRNGFVYEAAEAMRCIRSGRIESETVPHRLTLDCARVFDRMLAGTAE